MARGQRRLGEPGVREIVGELRGDDRRACRAPRRRRRRPPRSRAGRRRAARRTRRRPSRSRRSGARPAPPRPSPTRAPVVEVRQHRHAGERLDVERDAAAARARRRRRSGPAAARRAISTNRPSRPLARPSAVRARSAITSTSPRDCRRPIVPPPVHTTASAGQSGPGVAVGLERDEPGRRRGRRERVGAQHERIGARDRRARARARSRPRRLHGVVSRRDLAAELAHDDVRDRSRTRSCRTPGRPSSRASPAAASAASIDHTISASADEREHRARRAARLMAHRHSARPSRTDAPGRGSPRSRS